LLTYRQKLEVLFSGITGKGQRRILLNLQEDAQWEPTQKEACKMQVRQKYGLFAKERFCFCHD
jgi:hypothetical protein